MEFSNEVIAISKSSFLNIDYEKYVIGYEIETISKGKEIVISDLSELEFSKLKITIKRIQKALKFYRKNLK